MLSAKYSLKLTFLVSLVVFCW